MRGLGEQIAVLDGLSTIDPSDGANYTGGSDYSPGMPLLVSSAGLAGLSAALKRAVKVNPPAAARVVAKASAVLKRIPAMIPSSYSTDNVINASNGANWSGGSNYPEEQAIPLMTSSVGLAGMAAADQDLMQESNVISVQKVINASNGGNYSGGSNYPENQPIPLMTSSVGLAGFAAALKNAARVAPAKAAAVVKATTATLKRIPPMIPSSYSTFNNINASGGANYSGGSTYPDDQPIPLMTSSIGLSGLGVIDPSGGVNYGGGSNYPDSGRWPLLPSSSGLVGLAATADRFATAQGKKVAARVTGNLIDDAQNKIAAVYVSLQRVANDPKTSMQNRAAARQLSAALQSAAAASPQMAAWTRKATELWRKWQAQH